jgi:hypothetical protein
MSIQDLRRQLVELADAVPPSRVDPVAAITGRARRRRRRTRGTAVVVLAVAIASGLVIWTSAPSPTRRVTAGPPSTAATGTAAELAGYQWSTLPAAPIQPRAFAAEVWTGHELVIWGGGASDQSSAFGDGAAFDPEAGTWRTLAAAVGVAPRFDALPLWTGREMLIIGGSEPQGAVAANDAAYDPSTDRWRILAPRPAPIARPGAMGSTALSGVWTGTEAIVVSSSGATASYDPAADRWRSLETLPEPAPRQIAAVFPVWTGDHLLLWAEWEYFVTTNNGSDGYNGIDLWSLDPTAGRWVQSPPVQGQPRGIDAPVWTGTGVLLPAADYFRGGGSGGFYSNRNGFTYDPRTNTYRPISHGPVDDATIGALWTGNALVRVDQGTVFGDITPGAAAAWDPATDRWTTLPRAPAVDFGTPMFWTGHEILAYGPEAAVRFGPAPSTVPATTVMPAPAADSSLVPALQTHNPRVVVTPATGLHDGQTVDVRFSGFGVGGKVFLSECGSASAANSLGCGDQLAAQPFGLSDDQGNGQFTFTVKKVASTKPYDLTALTTCQDNCVIVATVGDGFGFASASLSFSSS